MVDRIKVAGVQMEPKLGEQERNLASCLEALRQAGSRGAQLIVFPECALTGYCFASLDEAMPLAEPIPGSSTERLAAACRQLGVYAVVGLLEKEGERCYNAAALVGPQGLVGSYRKIHLPYLGVDRFVTPGQRPFSVYETPIGRIGLNICYDTLFPESARVMALEGAEVIVLPTNWARGRERVPGYVINARALENKVNYLAVNRVGQERGFTFIGASTIASPLGDTLAKAGEGEEVIYAELDLALAREKHTIIVPGEFEFNLFKDRRPAFYGAITEGTRPSAGGRVRRAIGRRRRAAAPG